MLVMFKGCSQTAGQQMRSHTCRAIQDVMEVQAAQMTAGCAVQEVCMQHQQGGGLQLHRTRGQSILGCSKHLRRFEHVLSSWNPLN